MLTTVKPWISGRFRLTQIAAVNTLRSDVIAYDRLLTFWVNSFFFKRLMTNKIFEIYLNGKYYLKNSNNAILIYIHAPSPSSF